MPSEPPRAARPPFSPLRLVRRASAGLARRPVGAVAVSVVVAVSTVAGVAAIPEGAQRGPPHAVTVSGHPRHVIGRSETTRILQRERGSAARLPRASGVPPALTPASADSPPLRPHGEFGFAPYWTLGQAATVDVRELETVAYFALDVNPDGTITRSGTGWDGYESQAFANLVARAHASGDRVVLTVSCFSQVVLDQLTRSPSAATTLAHQVVEDIAAKHLDGVNLDLEGQGSTDQQGLTRLVATVARAVRSADPHGQVTMDTYASSAGDAGGFFDIRALSHVVDGFFVMAYDLNFDGTPTQGSVLTSSEFPDALAAAQYAAAVPPQKVVLGASFFGYEWPTSNGTLAASATGPPSPVSYGQAVSSGEPLYWDRVTQTAWSSFERDGQWYEAYFEDPEAVFLLAQLARHYGFGTGAWALGMQGGDPRMLEAIDGLTPGTGTGPTGPSWTPSSTRSPVVAASSRPATGRGGAAARRRGEKSASTPTSSTTSTSSTTTTNAPTTSTTTTTTTTTTATTTTTTGVASPHHYSGVVETTRVTLRKVAGGTSPTGTPTFVGTLTSFRTDDPSVSCLEGTPAPMDVWRYAGSNDDFVTARTPADCTTATFEFPASVITAPGTTTTTTTP